MWFLVAKRCGADDLLAEVADNVSLPGNDLAERGGEGSTSLDELSLQDRHPTSDGLHGLEQSVEDWFLQTPVVVFFVMVLKENVFVL